MNCHVIQRRLLSITDPERVPADLRAHLMGCAACREWHGQLLLLERHVRLLPIPPSNGKSKLIRRLSAETVTACPTASMATKTLSNTATLSQSPAATSRHSRTLFLGWAAAVLLIALGWLGLQSWLHRPLSSRIKPVADALLASLVQRDLRLARASSPRERIEILADLAEDLHGETNALAHAGSQEELTALASLYEEVVRQGILKQAEALSPADRQQMVATLVVRMAQTASQVEQLAREFPARCATPLHAIAATARAAQRQLRALTPEGKV